jgi:putative heme degradation protein
MLRNKVAHEQNAILSISSNQALDYAKTAIDLIKHFESYKRSNQLQDTHDLYDLYSHHKPTRSNTFVA